MGGLAPGTSSEGLRREFQARIGSVAEASVMEFYDRFQNTKRSRGFGFVKFETVEKAEEAVQKAWVEVEGKKCEVKRIDEGK